MTDSDLQAFKIIAEKSCGEPGRILKAVAEHLHRPAIVAKDRSLPSGETLRRACAIIRSITLETGEMFTGRSRRNESVAARHEAMRRLRALGLSTPWIARLLDLDSHATVVMALQRDANHRGME